MRLLAEMDAAIIDLIERDCAGQVTPAERAALSAWVGTDAGRRAEVEAYRQLVGHMRERSPVKIDTGATLERLRTVLARERRQMTNPPSALRWPSVAWGIAAAFVIVLGSSVLWRNVLAPSVIVSGREYTTLPGQRQTVRLADGTVVLMGPDSHFILLAGFGRSTRETTLNGEAYFRVRHDPVHPFAIRTTWGVTRDVGTAFAVRSYNDDSAMRVVVAEGRVEVSSLEAPVGSGPVFGAATATVIDGRGTMTTRSGIDLDQSLNWMQGGLVFKDTPLPQVVHDLERTFDLTIVLADTVLTHEILTASFGNQPPSAVLDVVVRSIGAEYKMTGRTVVIRRRTKSAQSPDDRGPPLSVLTAAGV